MAFVKTDQFSLASLFVHFKFGQQELAKATAFFYKSSDDIYLVSNWHNFSGRNAETLKPISNHAGLPDTVSCYLCLDQKYVSREWHDFSLSNNDSFLWLEHPQLQNAVDIGVLPVNLPSEFRGFAINEIDATDMRLEVSHDIFILGYPLGLMDSHGLPIWKRGSIASEPGTSAPSFLVDSASRPAMSGSPVIQRFRGFYKQDTSSKTPSPDDWFGEGNAFIGVYSGRLGASQLEAQLGIVWKQHLIQEIIDGKRVHQR